MALFMKKKERAAKSYLQLKLISRAQLWKKNVFIR